MRLPVMFPAQMGPSFRITRMSSAYPRKALEDSDQLKVWVFRVQSGLIFHADAVALLDALAWRSDHLTH